MTIDGLPDDDTPKPGPFMKFLEPDSWWNRIKSNRVYDTVPIDQPDWRSDMAGVTVLERPPLKSKRPALVKPVPAIAAATPAQELEEYTAVAASIGLSAPSLQIELFKQFLAAKDLPIFNLKEVIAYMNDKAAKEGAPGAGWLWRPLREKDQIDNLRIGKEAYKSYTGRDLRGQETFSEQAASDYYVGPGQAHYTTHGNMYFTTSPVDNSGVAYAEPTRRSGTPVYTRTVPIHALKKVALIESEFKHAPVHFFVSDYAPAPHTQYPDPFLMAILPNPAVAEGEGRFVLDFWDEPGFGISQQVK